MTALPDVITAGGDRLPAVMTPPAKDPYRVYLDGLGSPESRRTMRGCLDRVSRLLLGADLKDKAITGDGRGWHLLRYEHTSWVRARLIELGWAPKTINKHLSALRSVLKEAWRLGLMTAEDYQRAADLPDVKGTRVPAGQHAPIEIIAAILAACDADAQSDEKSKRPAGVRDGALIAALASTGARRRELVLLDFTDYQPADRALKVRGKGDKERLVYLASYALARLEAWLTVRGRTPGALFPRLERGGGIRKQDGRLAHMQGQGIADILAKRIKQASVSSRTPHDFRRTFIGELLDAGVDLAIAQALAGHASPATTSRYDRRPERARRAAVEKLPAPDVRPLHNQTPGDAT